MRGFYPVPHTSYCQEKVNHNDHQGPVPGIGWHEHEIFAAVVTHGHTLKSFDITKKWNSAINLALFIDIKRLRERRPPYILTDIEPAAGHRVLTDRVHITKLVSRTNPAKLEEPKLITGASFVINKLAINTTFPIPKIIFGVYPGSLNNKKYPDLKQNDEKEFSLRDE